jgi:hypothetical protein
VLDHVADLVGVGLIPAEMVVAGVEDQDVAFPYLDPLLDHPTPVRFGDHSLWRIGLAVARRVRQVDDRCRSDEKVVELQIGHILAGGEQVDLAVQVGAQVFGMGQ